MLAFQSAQGTGQTGPLSWAIYVVHADGSGLHRISAYGDLQPSWSPDGSRLAFSTPNPSMYPGTGDLYTMAADGSDVRDLEGVHFSPAYSRALVWNPVP
jgi:Tol biopolymer transport system component